MQGSSGKTSLAPAVRDPRGILTSADGRQDSGLGLWGPLPVPRPHFVEHLRRFTSNLPKAKPREKAVTSTEVSSGNRQQDWLPSGSRGGFPQRGRLALTAPPQGSFLGHRAPLMPRGPGGAWSGERLFMRVVAPASINLIHLSLRAGLGPEGCAWYPAALGSHVPGGQSWRQASRTPLGGECAIQR